MQILISVPLIFFYIFHIFQWYCENKKNIYKKKNNDTKKSLEHKINTLHNFLFYFFFVYLCVDKYERKRNKCTHFNKILFNLFHICNTQEDQFSSYTPIGRNNNASFNFEKCTCTLYIQYLNRQIKFKWNCKHYFMIHTLNYIFNWKRTLLCHIISLNVNFSKKLKLKWNEGKKKKKWWWIASILHYDLFSLRIISDAVFHFWLKVTIQRGYSMCHQIS